MLIALFYFSLCWSVVTDTDRLPVIPCNHYRSLNLDGVCIQFVIVVKQLNGSLVSGVAAYFCAL